MFNRMHSTLSNVIWFSFATVILVNVSATNYQQDITFVFYDQNNLPVYKSDSIQDNLIGSNLTNCDPTGNVTIIVHGWSENCDIEWINEMIPNFQKYRHGCIICMDYYNFSRTSNYFQLVRHFDGIAEVLTDKIRQLNDDGFDPNKFLMFGFSFGAQLVIEAGRRFGPQRIAEIDACEPAGPGFDRNSTYNRLDPKQAAQNVQCIHTSSDKGTSKRDCHQNWNMGNCGRSQVAAGPRPKGSHGLCPYFYNSAFDHKFMAVHKAKNCETSRRCNEMWPIDFRMGFWEDRKREVNGCDLYANTYKYAPYNEEESSSNQI